jgi:hypothetical protein
MSPRLAGSHNGRRPPGITLTIPEAATAARALDAAIALMYSHLAVPCPNCQEGPCAQHAADMETARAYRELRAELGAQLPRSGDRWAELAAHHPARDPGQRHHRLLPVQARRISGQSKRPADDDRGLAADPVDRRHGQRTCRPRKGENGAEGAPFASD